MAGELIDEGDESITHTWVGREFNLDRLSEVNWSLLQQNLDSARRVLANPAKFPAADFDALETTVFELDAFMLRRPFNVRPE